jgi:hypothetical protein
MFTALPAARKACPPDALTADGALMTWDIAAVESSDKVAILMYDSLFIVGVPLTKLDSANVCFRICVQLIYFVLRQKVV